MPWRECAEVKGQVEDTGCTCSPRSGTGSQEGQLCGIEYACSLADTAEGRSFPGNTCTCAKALHFCTTADATWRLTVKPVIHLHLSRLMADSGLGSSHYLHVFLNAESTDSRSNWAGFTSQARLFLWSWGSPPPTPFSRSISLCIKWGVGPSLPEPSYSFSEGRTWGCRPANGPV